MAFRLFLVVFRAQIASALESRKSSKTAQAWFRGHSVHGMEPGPSKRNFHFVDGLRGPRHDLSHGKDISGKTQDDDGKTSWSCRDEKREMYNRSAEWLAAPVAWLLPRLKSIDDRGRPPLDSRLIVDGAGMADGHEHSGNNLPLLPRGGTPAGVLGG